MDILECVLNFIYPPICGICFKENEKYICNDCLEMLKFISKNKKEKYKSKYVEELLYIFDYEGTIRQKILDYKFKDKSFLHSTFSKLILNNEENIKFIKSYDILIPVPIHKKRMKERGYNQSELIAKDIVSEIKNIKFEKKVLIKTSNIAPQSSLNKKQREDNIKNVYRVKNKEKIVNKRILILDDIYTTGSTVNECAKILKEAGCKDIGVITIAKD